MSLILSDTASAYPLLCVLFLVKVGQMRTAPRATLKEFILRSFEWNAKESSSAILVFSKQVYLSSTVTFRVRKGKSE